MKDKLLNAIELIDESTIKLPIKYLNGDNIRLKILKNGDFCSISDEVGLYNALSDEARVNFASFVENWRFEFDKIKINKNNALVWTDIRCEYVTSKIGLFVSALLMINDFAERGEYRKEFYIIH